MAAQTKDLLPGLRVPDLDFPVGVHGDVAANRSEEATPVWSPDGLRLAFVSDRDGTRLVYSVAPDGSDLRRLSPGPGPNFDARWKP